MGDTAAVRNRIREMYPGDQNKTLRNRLYSKPGFLASDPTDEMIREEAGWDVGTIEGDVIGQAKSEPLATLPEIPPAINTADEYLRASEIYGKLSKMLRDSEAKRKELTRPILDAKSKIDEEFKAANAPIEAAVKQLDSIMKDFKAREREALREMEAERQRVIREETAKAQAEAEARRAELDEVKERISVNQDPFLAALLEEDRAEAVESAKDAIRNAAMVPARISLPVAQPVKAEGSRVTYDWVWEVTNENEIPRELLSIDPKKMNARVRDLKASLDGDITRIKPEDLKGFIIKEVPRIGGR